MEYLTWPIIFAVALYWDTMQDKKEAQRRATLDKIDQRLRDLED